MSTPPTLGLRVRAMEMSDLSFVCASMREHLPGGFFAELGDGFLSAYLRTYATSPSGCAFVAEVDGRQVGFLVGSVDREAYRHHVMRADRGRLLRRGILSLALRPSLAIRFAHTRMNRYLRGLRRCSRVGSTSPSDSRLGILSHIAVATDARGAGVGRDLLDSFLTVCSAHKTPRLQLFVDPSNTGARQFYQSNGWTDASQQTDADGRQWNTMEMTLET
ncbi:GNAT family N-acetyltransferase [Brevibacterium aurantiacum]|uniref:GNAT family N-acetyltransferase n=1 Tax=Brevibacterium aurantiacum TaxID=273384 RepID=UPI0014554D01|nr:GNAT family N-acetyltransferase [Brevibacterium aurantiacum]MDN5551232.1 GNAT family N-acetyltransferase [Brevibacterium sp.]